MNKVTVTKSQMKAIKQQRDVCRIGLDNIIKGSIHGFFGGASTPLHHMNVEQIVLAWHGHAEVEPEYVSFEEAKKALEDGKNVVCEFNDKKYEYYMRDGIVNTKNMIRNTGNIAGWHDMWDQILGGKWTIESENNG